MIVCNLFSRSQKGLTRVLTSIRLLISIVRRQNNSKGFEQMGGISVIAANGPENSGPNEEVLVLEQLLTSDLPQIKANEL